MTLLVRFALCGAVIGLAACGDDGRGGDGDAGMDTDTDTDTDDDGGPDAGECTSGTWFGSLTITSQDQLSAFEGFTDVQGSLTISGSVNDLSSLFCLEVIQGKLEIANTELTNLDGLGGITSMDGALIISDNTALTSLEGLSNTTWWYPDYDYYSDENLVISGNTALTNLDGLGVITSVEGNVIISDNTALTNLNGLSNLERIGGYYSGRWGPIYWGDLLLQNNPALTSLDGLINLTAIGEYLEINDNINLPQCEACDLAEQVGKSCSCSGNLADTCTDTCI